jgi:hypothetical protein
MSIETKLRGFLVLSILILLWEMVMWNNDIIIIKTQQKTIDSLSIQTSDLQYELFNAQVEIGRHEITREEILVPHKELNKEYEEYYTNQTE